MKIQSVNGSYLPCLGTIAVTSKLLRSSPQQACPVCCQYFARDREMIVVKARGSRFWVCLSNLQMGDTGCGLAFPMQASEDLVDALVRKRSSHLQPAV